MDFNSAIESFSKVKSRLQQLTLKPELNYSPYVVRLEMDAISSLIVSHYSGNLKGQGEIWGTSLIGIYKGAYNNDTKLLAMIDLVTKVIIELDDNRNRRDSSNLAEEKISNLKHQISILEDDKQILEFANEALTEKSTALQKKLEAIPKATDIVHSDIHGQYTLDQLKFEYDSVVKTNIVQGHKCTELSNLFEQEKSKSQRLDKEFYELKNRPIRKELYNYLFYSLLFVSLTILNFSAYVPAWTSNNIGISVVLEVVLIIALVISFSFNGKDRIKHFIALILATLAIFASKLID